MTRPTLGCESKLLRVHRIVEQWDQGRMTQRMDGDAEVDWTRIYRQTLKFRDDQRKDADEGRFGA
jgi:hypothetical protein